jgi:hypothetical protein
MPRSIKKNRLRHTRKVVRIELSDELVAEIDSIVTRAFRQARKSERREGKAAGEQFEDELFKTSLAPVKVEQAITNFVGHTAYAIPAPVFRKLVSPKSGLVKAIATLVDQLPRDGEPPIEQMRALFCFGDAELARRPRSASAPSSISQIKHRRRGGASIDCHRSATPFRLTSPTKLN